MKFSAGFSSSFLNNSEITGAPRTNNAIEGRHHSLNAYLNNVQAGFLF